MHLKNDAAETENVDLDWHVMVNSQLIKEKTATIRKVTSCYCFSLYCTEFHCLICGTTGMCKEMLAERNWSGDSLWKRMKGFSVMHINSKLLM